jgi:ribosome-binding factor A
MSRRTDRLASTLQQELAMIIMRELSDPRLTHLPSITRVKVSEDLALADVYITSMGTPGQQTAALNALKHSAGLMRTKLTKILSMRTVPYLRFHIDEQLKKEIALLDLLHQVELETAETERRRAAEAAGQSGPPADAAQTDAAQENAAAGDEDDQDDQDKEPEVS